MRVDRLEWTIQLPCWSLGLLTSAHASPLYHWSPWLASRCHIWSSNLLTHPIARDDVYGDPLRKSQLLLLRGSLFSQMKNFPWTSLLPKHARQWRRQCLAHIAWRPANILYRIGASKTYDECGHAVILIRSILVAWTISVPDPLQPSVLVLESRIIEFFFCSFTNTRWNGSPPNRDSRNRVTSPLCDDVRPVISLGELIVP